MTAPKFMFECTRLTTFDNNITIDQESTGVLKLNLRDNVTITHNYRRNDLMLLNIYNESYVIANRNLLDGVIRIRYDSKTDVLDNYITFANNHLSKY